VFSAVLIVRAPVVADLMLNAPTPTRSIEPSYIVRPLDLSSFQPSFVMSLNPIELMTVANI